MPCHKFHCLLITPKYITKPCIPPCSLWLSMNNSLMRVISRKKSLQIAIQIIKFIFKVKIWMRRFTIDFLKNFKYRGPVFRADRADYWIAFCTRTCVKVEGLVRSVVGVWEVESSTLNSNASQFTLKRPLLIPN